MKTIGTGKKVAMLLGGILIATFAAGCFGGDPNYSDRPYTYNTSYGVPASGDYFPYSPRIGKCHLYRTDLEPLEPNEKRCVG
jgi:hypothetical protein